MKKLIALLALSLLSFNAFALNETPVDGTDGLEIVALLEELNVKNERNGQTDTGLINIRLYKFLGMECETANTRGGGYGSEYIGACYFDAIKTKEAFNNLKLVLKYAGLNPANKFFNYNFQE